MLCLGGIIFLAVMSVCRFVGLWTWTATWIFSSKEEKMNLTKGTGHFNANGYFVSVWISPRSLYYFRKQVPSDSMGDINLCYSGSFKRFDNVDHDAVTSLISPGPDPASVFPASPQLKPPNYPHEISLPYDTVRSNDLSGRFPIFSCSLHKMDLFQLTYLA